MFPLMFMREKMKNYLKAYGHKILIAEIPVQRGIRAGGFSLLAHVYREALGNLALECTLAIQ